MRSIAKKLQLKLSAGAGIASVAAILAIATFASTGCGTDDAKEAFDPATQAAVVKAADVTSKQSRGTEMTIDGILSAGGETGSIKGDGVFDDDGVGKLTMDIDAGENSVSIEEIINRTVVYMRSDAFDELTDGKKWLKVDLAAAAKQQGFDISALTNGAPSSPSQALDYLKGAGDTQKLGTEVINGLPTTRYHVDVDLRKAAQKASPNAEKTMDKLIEIIGHDTLPIDVWVDSKDRVRREQIKMEFDQKGKTQSVDMTIDLTRFNVPLRITIPSDDETLDASKLLAQE